MTEAGNGDDHVAPGPRLYAASRHHAAKAREHRRQDDNYGRLDAAFHAGAAIELIAKAVLADLDPRLLADGARAQHALLEAVAELRSRSGTVSGSGGGGRATISASVALELASRLDSGCASHKSAAVRVLRARNAAVHMAEGPSAAGLMDLLASMEAFTDAAARFLRGSSHDYWGVHFEEVTRDREAAQRALERRATAKVGAAAKAFQSMLAGLPEELRTRVIEELQRRGGTAATLSGDIVGEADCPACQQVATVAWDGAVEVEQEMPGEYLYQGYWELVGLRCPVCGLALDADEIEILSLDVGDPSDYERDYLDPGDYLDASDLAHDDGL